MIASSVVISFTGLIVRHVDADPMVMNFYRALSLMVAITLILAIQYRRMAITHVIRIGWPGIAGGVMLTVAAICFLQSMTNTTVANTLFILGAIPFFTAALAWVFLKERPAQATLWAMVIAFCGIAVMLGEGFGSGSAYGNMMAMGTAICFSVYTVLVRRNRHVNMLPALLVSTVLITLVAGVTRYGSLTISTDDPTGRLTASGSMSMRTTSISPRRPQESAGAVNRVPTTNATSTCSQMCWPASTV